VVNGTPGIGCRARIGREPAYRCLSSSATRSAQGTSRNLSRPGANITGFSTFEPEIAGKWLQLLEEVSPGMKNAEHAAATRSLLVSTRC